MEAQQSTPEPSPRRGVRRRTALKAGGTVAATVAAMNLIDLVAWRPLRPSVAEAATLPDIQFDIGQFISPPTTIDGVTVQFGPVYTIFATARLSRLPTKTEQTQFVNAMSALEATYPFSPNAAMTFVAYGLPYFRKLPGGLASGSVASRFIPRLASNTSRFVLEEAVASPTDVSSANPSIVKRKFQVPVRIEQNDLLFTIRGDNSDYLTDILKWIGGSNTLAGHPIASPLKGVLSVTSSRLMFQQMGLPRYVAANDGFLFQDRINARSPMWMGFVDQQVAGSGPAPAVTFQGNASARLTTARAGDYFDNGSVQHLSHVIQDLEAFYARAGEADQEEDETFLERVQYMFRSTPPPSFGNTDQFFDGGGPAFLQNEFKGTGDAAQGAAGIGTPEGEHRIGHLAALQRSSRAGDGTPLHIRMDGPGFDAMDVPSGTPRPGTSGNVPKLQFTVFVPTADFFTRMRRNQASLDLAAQFAVDEDENGLERFLTATRRQNFLVPPRRHRALPLLELT
jgi:hypothetical protein